MASPTDTEPLAPLAPEVVDPAPTTAAQLLALPRGTGKRYELIEGRLITMTPAGADHGRVESRCVATLARDLSDAAGGEVFTGDTGFRLAGDPDTVRVPDAAFVSAARIAAAGDLSGYFPGAPDLAVEVVSPSDTFSAVEDKARMWLAHGTRLVWVAVPTSRTVHVYRAGSSTVTILEHTDTLGGDDVLPGFAAVVADFFPPPVAPPPPAAPEPPAPASDTDA